MISLSLRVDGKEEMLARAAFCRQQISQGGVQHRHPAARQLPTPGKLEPEFGRAVFAVPGSRPCEPGASLGRVRPWRLSSPPAAKH